MDFEEIAERAFKREGIEKFWELPKRHAYLQLENLYYNYKIGNISKEKSIIEKNKIKKEYDYFEKEYIDDFNTHKKYFENEKENDMLLIDIEKSNDKDEILKKSIKIISRLINDKNFEERILTKLYKSTQGNVNTIKSE